MKSRKVHPNTRSKMSHDGRAHGNSMVQVFNAEWDETGVYVYQAFNDQIADYAVEHQTLGGPAFKPLRMTWVKPSFAWVLYRSGYGTKSNQERILKIKIGHDDLGQLLSKCACGHGRGGTLGRVQWDPERDIMSTVNGREPRKMLRTRAIQIGLSRDLSEKYVQSIISVQDVTELAHRVGEAHWQLKKNPKSTVIMEELIPYLPAERPYVPHTDQDVLVKLALAPGKAAEETARIGLGKAATSKVRN